MLKIINDLQPFFEDCYRRINVREYARIIGVSPPTASKLLSHYWRERLLVPSRFKNYILFYANKSSPDFIDLSRMYWRGKLQPFLENMGKEVPAAVIVLFGSLAKGEAKADSDVDIAVFGAKKQVDVSLFEKKLKRSLQLFWYCSLKDVKSPGLANNVLNGYVIKGRVIL